MTLDPARLFVPPDSITANRLTLRGSDAERAYQRGARRGRTLMALDDSGWEFTVMLEEAGPDVCSGPITARALAAERRTKVSLYQGLLHPSDFRRLLSRATATGVVAFVPVIADGSVVPDLGPDGTFEGVGDWPQLVRAAAERSGRGRRPTTSLPMLFDQALVQATSGGTVILLHRDSTDLKSVLTDRPFAINVFCPPPGGFSEDERARAHARGIPIVAPPANGEDPIAPALSALAAIFFHLEEA